MNTEIVAIGDPAKIRDVVGRFDYAEGGDVFVASVPSTQCVSVIASLAREGIKAVSHKQFLKAIQTTKKCMPLQKIDSSEAFKWFRTGLEFFGITYSNSFEMCSVDKKDVKTLNKVEQISSCTMSNNGAIYGFVRGSSASLHINDSLDLVFDVRLEETIESVTFDPSDSFVALETASSVVLYDIFRGICLGSFKVQPFYFTAGSIHLCDQDLTCRLDGTDPTCILDRISRMELKTGRRLIACSKNRTAKFIDGKIQRIVYDNGGCITSKTHAYIRDVQFIFSDSGLYALITKNTGSHDQYILENFMDNRITTLNLDSRPESISVSDDMFVLQDSSFEVGFFSRDRYIFRKVKGIRKEGPVLIALRNSVCAIYDSETSHVEFYDKTELRSVYIHPDCANLLWSQSGLYLASFSTSEVSGCLVQIFDNNGALMFKRIFGCLRDFTWRPYMELNPEAREKILQEHQVDNLMDEVEDEKETGGQLAEWKSYLLSKIQSISGHK